MAQTVVLIESDIIRRLRLLTLFLLAFGVGMLFWGVDLIQHYGLNPGDGGLLKPIETRLTAGLLLMAIGLLPLLGMHWYLKRYVCSLRVEGDTLQVEVAGWLWTKRLDLPVTAVEGIEEHTDTVWRRRAPWESLRIAGTTFILDSGNGMLDHAALRRLERRATRPLQTR